MATVNPPYLSLLKQKMSRDPYAVYITLATVENGPRGGVVPRARTVVFEGFLRDEADRLGIALKCSADSNKISKRVSDEVEICWWMDAARTQFRFRGQMVFDTRVDSANRVQTWRHLSAGDRAQFFYPPDKVATSHSDEPFVEQSARFQASAGDVADNFVLGLLVPLEVDVLDLNDCSRKYWRRESVDKDDWSETSGFAPPVVSFDALVE